MFAPFDIIRVVVGAAILYLGADWLIRGSTGTARWLGVKPLIIGLTVVAYGTSAPELAVSTKAMLAHQEPIALGTVIGSCIANISLVLGLTALIAPPTIDGRIIRREVPVLLGSVVALPLCLRDGEIGRFEGAILIGCAVLFTLVTLTVSARSGAADTLSVPRVAAEPTSRTRFALIALPMMALGLALLIIGSNLFVEGARSVAFRFQMSDRMLGLTVVAIGTAMPELIASLVAALRGHAGLAVGTVIGSNLMNVFLVLGVCAYISPIRVGEKSHTIDFIGLIVITLLGVITLRGPRQVRRFEGAILVLAYVGFVIAASIF
ncbi:MAG: calcium/sodium antiporter [Kofleriaceae bacterium]|nr:calcium/sodium antiporter [Kofleriaceae bacterium]